ncbi:olfactory receptor class A-like protein 1 [Protopterus annectens]|uniref:olfactory receptor class A-like protein 1 n=1 Tax=Protopterus annectens TaxID=7888 RepID=UPI001CFB926B|nr:olfactory receptor class A-like protein 1 [Protopterus annectens]
MTNDGHSSVILASLGITELEDILVIGHSIIRGNDTEICRENNEHQTVLCLPRTEVDEEVLYLTVMEAYDIIKGMVFLAVVVSGIPGNIVVAISFICLTGMGYKLLLTDIFICKIAIVNLVLILTRGLPVTLFVLFSLKNLYSDVECKVIMYLARVSRGMAICLTCILVCIQCITLSPTTSKLFVLKLRLSKYSLIAFYVIFGINMIAEISPPMYTVSKINSTNLEYTFHFGYCIVHFADYTPFMLTAISYIVRDFVFLILMTTASLSIFLILIKHKKQIKEIRSDMKNQSQSAETKAAKVVVTLASLYVFFIGFENAIFLYQTLVTKNPIISDVRHFFSVCYSSIFPAVIIIANKRVQNSIKCRYE